MKNLYGVILVLSCATNASALVNNDHDAYDYCVSHGSSYIAIVWPLAQGKDNQIEQLLRKYGSLKYQKQIYFTYDQAFALLKDAHPHITDMHSHMNWYFPSHALAKPARVYLMKFASLETAVKCKHAIRALFNLGYTSIHINDYHHEVLKLAQFFFNAGANKRTKGIKDISYFEAYCACLRLMLRS